MEKEEKEMKARHAKGIYEVGEFASKYNRNGVVVSVYGTVYYVISYYSLIPSSYGNVAAQVKKARNGRLASKSELETIFSNPAFSDIVEKIESNSSSSLYFHDLSTFSGTKSGDKLVEYDLYDVKTKNTVKSSVSNPALYIIIMPL